ncbi:alpha-2-macroglobulin-like isoform X3 [Symsagittifera roscoffensis]|uniref:alpha-2-macroglobulin-like isoform X3 n=1 Tax=Symsagittifera roscoffensis TaxID=84072 RepID=UPI00307C44B5
MFMFSALVFTCVSLNLFSAETTRDPCDFLVYGSGEVANGIVYKGALYWAGCSDGNTMDSIDIQLKDEDGTVKAEKSVDLSSVWSPPPPGTVGLTAGVYVPFTLDVPLDACKEDGRTGHGMSLWVSSQTVPQLAKSVSVDCMDNSKVFLVQMNKPLYKPGDNIEAQVLCIERDNTHSCESVNISISILTPSSLTMNVQHFTIGSNRDHGQVPVAEYSFQLAEKPVMGEYCLRVESQVAAPLQKCFQIEEYVLPSFQASIQFDQVAVVLEKLADVSGVLSAEYTYGQPVQQPHFLMQCWLGGAGQVQVGRDTEYPDKNGNYNFIIPVADIERAKSELAGSPYWNTRPDSLLCSVVANEVKDSELPTQQAQATLPIEPKEIIVECCDSFSCPEVVRPGNFSFCVKVRYATGVHHGEALDSGLLLSTSFSPCATPDAQTSQLRGSQVVVGERVELKLTAYNKNDSCSRWDSSNNFNAAVLRASKGGHVSDSFSVDVGLFTSTMEVFLTVSICDEQEGSSYSKGDEVCLLAHIHPAVAAAQVNSMLLILKSRGVVRETRVETVSSFPHKVHVTVSADMSPNFVALLSAHSSNQTMTEVMPASITVPVQRGENMFENRVSLSAVAPDGRDHFLPGENASVVVQMGSDDSVAVLIGLDKKVIALGGRHNIISLDTVVEALAEEDLSRADDDNDFGGGFIVFCWFPLPSRSANAQSTIADAGFVYISAGKVTVPGEEFEYAYAYPMRGVIKSGTVVNFDAFAGFAVDYENTAESVLNEQTTSTRSHFTENILFSVFIASGSSEFSVDVAVGDTITTHELYASVLSPTAGFATLLNPLELRVFKEVFCRVNVAYSVKRKESFSVSISVCNYNPQQLPLSPHIEVSYSKDAFSEPKTDDSCSVMSSSGALEAVEYQQCRLFVCSLVAKKVGNPALTVTISPDDQPDSIPYDIFVKQVKVKAEGCEQRVDLGKKELVSEDSEQCYNLTIPRDAITNSGLAHVRLYSQMVGPALSNPDKLVRQPTGCGEQNMIYMAPLVYLRQILQAIGVSLDREKEDQLTRFMSMGYQRELTYKHDNGGYSAFGQQSGNPSSTWLTAFVVKTFSEAARSGDVQVSMETLLDSLSYILSPEVIVTSDSKEGEGSTTRVVETGEVLHKEMQGGSSGEATLAAYVLLSVCQVPRSLVDDDNITTDQLARLQKVAEQLESQLETELGKSNRDNYLLGLGGSALCCYKDKFQGTGEGTECSDTAGSLLARVQDSLLSCVDQSEKMCGRYHWQRTGGCEERAVEVGEDEVCGECKPQQKDSSHRWYSDQDSTSSSMQVETTAYALTFLTQFTPISTEEEANSVTVGDGAVKWLGCEQSPNGGYSSTQDTVTAFYALSVHAHSTEQTDLKVNVTEDGILLQSLSLQDSVEVFLFEFLDIPKEEVESDDGGVRVCVETGSGGTGRAFMAGEIYYNTEQCEDGEGSGGDDMQIVISKIKEIVVDDGRILTVVFVITYAGEEEEEAGGSGMVVVEIQSPSGFCCESVSQNGPGSKIDMYECGTGPDGKTLSVYFNNMLSGNTELEVVFFKCEMILNPQASEARVGLYYDTAVQSRIMYQVAELSLGDEPCANCLTNRAPQLHPLTTPAPIYFTLLLTCLLLLHSSL